MLYPLFEWFELTMVGEIIRSLTWLFPFIEAFHLLAFAVLGGAVLLVDLRLIGLAFRSQPVAHVAREIQPWLRRSLAVALVSGSLLFLSESVKCYYSEPFWIKITGLFFALIFTFTIRRKVTMAEAGSIGPIWGRVVGMVSIGLWATVAWGGRWIGFSG